MNENYKKEAESLFKSKKEFAAKVKKNLINQEPINKIINENDAPNLHSYNNYGENIDIINKKQQNLNELYKKLTKEQKDVLKKTYHVFSEYDKGLDLL